MRMVTINGSPKGAGSNTQVLVEAFMKGARDAGAETVTVFLADKNVRHCRGCHSCWSRGPGQCAIADEMAGILPIMAGADIIALATPVYFGNISGMLKAFMDRMTMIGGPQSSGGGTGGTEPVQTGSPSVGPRLMAFSSCGLADWGEFDVVSLWMRKVCAKMNMELAGEAYATQGRLLVDPTAEVLGYLGFLGEAGRKTASGVPLSVTERMRMASGFAPR